MPLARKAFAIAAVALCAAVQAQTLPAPQNVVSLSASATAEIPRDLLQVGFSTSREGPDAQTVQSQLKQALDAALAEARKVARPGQIELHTGNFALYPRYSNKGVANGWQGSAELVVEGRDVAGIAQFTGRVTTMTIARVGYSLSREAREKAEAELSAEAIGRFRSKADAISRQFGFGGWGIREVSVSSNEPPSGVYPMAMKARSAMADEALPVEAGKASVTVTVGGSVQMSAK
ncbi:SIMPL domain-containing protein [Rubrivivax gelatinosus]|uniref:SIMPL domain-containing protein n=1 Tax=Rubrivivax gelatinosus TaxID=28068 RepID=UPI001905B928|nr:SIMPL domain-containing protein [Rubrivivax gelatinosus]MBK1613695.1 SIMPL domain-containing protein [Rubrivivax gelatinosus]